MHHLHRGGKLLLLRPRRSELEKRRKQKKIGNEKLVDSELKVLQLPPRLLLSASKLTRMAHSLDYQKTSVMMTRGEQLEERGKEKRRRKAKEPTSQRRNRELTRSC